MRVIAGKLRRRTIASPKGRAFRPTLDRVRESIFNVLGDDIIDACVLDLFCGGGSLGIEALSRGAMRAVFVDNDKSVLDLAAKNVARLGIEQRARLARSDAFAFLRSHRNSAFDIVFADPPYDHHYGSQICHEILESSVSRVGGIFVLERSRQESVDSGSLRLVKNLRFGQTEVDFYLREDEDENSALPGDI